MNSSPRCSLFALLLTAGCAASPPAAGPSAGRDPADPADTALADTADTTRDTADSGRDTAPDDGLVGVRLDPPVDPPAFLVENQRREPRTPDWLVGDPAVLWFFRDAGST